jgi:hypothetical protein
MQQDRNPITPTMIARRQTRLQPSRQTPHRDSHTTYKQRPWTMTRPRHNPLDPAAIAMQNDLVSLVVRINGRDSEDQLPISAGQSEKEELTRFLNRHGPYAQIWIRLTSGEYVRYDHILSIRIGA